MKPRADLKPNSFDYENQPLVTANTPASFVAQAVVGVEASDPFFSNYAFCPPGKCVHCTSRNRSGTFSSLSEVSSMTTGNRNGRSATIK